MLTFPLFNFSSENAHWRPFIGRLLLASALGIASFYLTSMRYQFPKENAIKTGIADIEMAAVKLNRSPFGSIWNYKGTLRSFVEKDRLIARDIPVLVPVPLEKNLRPPANFRYQFPARLKKTAQDKYVITPFKNAPWQPKEKLYNLAEWRYSAKLAVQKTIQESIQNPHVGSFLAGITTGEFDDHLLAFELGRFGLQHLMAISGIHFSILATLIGLSAGLFFSRHTAISITLGLMSVYFIFLGASASVTRAWVAIMIGLAGLLIQRRSLGFNTWGIAALILILWDPLSIGEIGFQFSFGITAAILLWFSPCDALVQLFFSKRKLSEVLTMDYWDQHGYCVLYFLRQSLALAIAVNLVALPLTLYHFHKFPLMGLIYNLFFPFLVSFSLILVLLACLLQLVFPWLATHLHLLNEYYTQFVLNFAFNLPKAFDFALQITDFPKEVLSLYLLLTFSLGIVLNQHFKPNASF